MSYQDQQLKDARLVEEMINQKPWSDHPHTRMALAVAARTIKRGRHLTDAEKVENLAKAMEEDGSSEAIALAERMRTAAGLKPNSITSAKEPL